VGRAELGEEDAGGGGGRANSRSFVPKSCNPPPPPPPPPPRAAIKVECKLIGRRCYTKLRGNDYGSRRNLLLHARSLLPLCNTVIRARYNCNANKAGALRADFFLARRPRCDRAVARSVKSMRACVPRGGPVDDESSRILDRFLDRFLISTLAARRSYTDDSRGSFISGAVMSFIGHNSIN